MKEIIEKSESLGYHKFFNHSGSEQDNEWPIRKHIELCLIQKWIYEKFGMWIELSKIDGLIAVSSFICCVKMYPEEYYVGSFKKPEQALEEGIKKALEILEKK